MEIALYENIEIMTCRQPYKRQGLTYELRTSRDIWLKASAHPFIIRDGLSNDNRKIEKNNGKIVK